MSEGLFSIIIPSPEFSANLPVLQSLNQIAHPELIREIWVAAGRNPSVQRNAATAQASGEYLVFLDSDSAVPPDYFLHLKNRLTFSPDIIGGPVLLPSDAPPCQQVFQALLSHPIISGATASRYRAQGVLRSSSECELILCNLAVRSSVFSAIGNFNDQLYPNEENAWMELASRSGCKIFYDPDLVVRRHQRESWPAFFRMLFNYGRGRIRQAWLTRDFFHSKLLVGPFLLIALVITLSLGLWGCAAAILAAGIYGIACSMSLPRNSTISRGMILVSAFTVPLVYGLGQIAGLFALGKRPIPPVEVVRVR